MSTIIVSPAKVVVAASGTGVTLSATRVPIVKLVVQALAANTGSILVGDSTVDKTDLNGIVLLKGEKLEIFSPNGDLFDLADIYIDSTVNGEGVSLLYYKKV